LLGILLFFYDVVITPSSIVSFLYFLVSSSLYYECFTGILTTYLVIIEIGGWAILNILHELGRWRSDARVNKKKTWKFSFKSGKFESCKWEDIKLGDIIEILREEEFPCDVIILESSEKDHKCYIDASGLTENHNLKVKYSCDDT